MNIKTIRAHLKPARQPEELRETAKLLRSQLSTYERSNAEDRAALAPEILKCVAQMEKGVYGR